MVSTIIPIPLSPAEIARNITTKMEFVRESLFSKGEYLADSDILDRVLWEPVGSGHQLMIKPDHPTTPISNNVISFSGALIAFNCAYFRKSGK